MTTTADQNKHDYKNKAIGELLYPEHFFFLIGTKAAFPCKAILINI